MSLPRDITDLIERLRVVAVKHSIHRLVLSVEDMPDEPCATFAILPSDPLTTDPKEWGAGTHFVLDKFWRDTIEDSLTKEIKTSITVARNSVHKCRTEIEKQEKRCASANKKCDQFNSLIPDLITELGNITKDQS